MTKQFSKTELERLYIEEKFTPSKIASLYGCNHKTVRKYIKAFSIPERLPQEFNFLPKASHVNPGHDQLMSPLSIMAHMAYLCEGATKNRPRRFDFCNCNLKLIELIKKCLYELYQIKKHREIIHAPSCEACKEAELMFSSPHQKIVVNEKIEKTLIIVRSGGVNLATDFIANARWILNELNQSFDADELRKLSSKVSPRRKPARVSDPRWNFTYPVESKLKSLISFSGHAMYLCEGHNNGQLAGLSFTNTNVEILKKYLGFLRSTYAPVNTALFVSGMRGTNKALEDSIASSAVFVTEKSRKIAIARIKTSGKELSQVFQQNANMLIDTVLTSKCASDESIKFNATDKK